MSFFDDDEEQITPENDIPAGFEEVTPDATEEVDLDDSGLSDFTFEEGDELGFTEEDSEESSGI